jgi:hypothetical protein
MRRCDKRRTDGHWCILKQTRRRSSNSLLLGWGRQRAWTAAQAGHRTSAGRAARYKRGGALTPLGALRASLDVLCCAVRLPASEETAHRLATERPSQLQRMTVEAVSTTKPLLQVLDMLTPALELFWRWAAAAAKIEQILATSES